MTRWLVIVAWCLSAGVSVAQDCTPQPLSKMAWGAFGVMSVDLETVPAGEVWQVFYAGVYIQPFDPAYNDQIVAKSFRLQVRALAENGACCWSHALKVNDSPTKSTPVLATDRTVVLLAGRTLVARADSMEWFTQMGLSAEGYRYPAACLRFLVIPGWGSGGGSPQPPPPPPDLSALVREALTTATALQRLANSVPP